jgi:putative flippase GtrA
MTEQRALGWYDRAGLGGICDRDRARQIAQFCLVGGSGIIVDGGLSALAIHLGVFYLLANHIGYLVAVTWNFALNYRFTWGQPDGSVRRMFAEYVAADLLLFVVRIGVVGGLVELADVQPVVATLVGILVVAAATFVVADRVVFDGGDDD